MQGLLFENTIWFVAVLLLAEYALLVMWLRRRTPQSRAAVLVGLVVCLTVPVLQRVVTTQRERITLICKSLVSAVEAGNVATIETHISKSFAADGLDRDEFIDAVRSALNQSNIEDVSLTIDNIVINAGSATVVIRVRCMLTTDEYSGTFPSKWRLSLKKEGDGWFVADVIPIRTPTFPVDRLRQLIR